MRLGLPIATAAATCGVSDRTVRYWRARGMLDLERPTSIAEAQLAGVIGRQAARSWKAAAFMLEVSYPERWARPRPPPARQSGL